MNMQRGQAGGVGKAKKFREKALACMKKKDINSAEKLRAQALEGCRAVAATCSRQNPRPRRPENMGRGRRRESGHGLYRRWFPRLCRRARKRRREAVVERTRRGPRGRKPARSATTNRLAAVGPPYSSSSAFLPNLVDRAHWRKPTPDAVQVSCNRPPGRRTLSLLNADWAPFLRPADRRD